MRFDLLMDGVIADPALRGELDALVQRKRRGGEQDGFTPPPLTAAYVADEILRLASEAPALPPELQKSDLDGIFIETLAAAWRNVPRPGRKHAFLSASFSASDCL